VPPLLRWPPFQVGAVLAIAIAAGLGTFFATRSDGQRTSAPTVPLTTPVGRTGKRVAQVTPAGLRTLSRALGRKIYWAGRQPGTTYELTELPHRVVYVRYLPPGTAIGAGTPVLTVGTYPAHGAFAEAEQRVGKSGVVQVPAKNGGVAFSNTRAPTSVYVAFPGSDYLIEVFDPSAERARQLVTSGKIVPIR
jgi:hypothetical protein